MLDIVCEYGKEYDIIFYPDKYKSLSYNNGSTCVNSIEVNDIKVPAKQITDQLGNLVGPDVKDRDSVSITNNFIKTVNNYMLSIFGK